MRIGYDSVAMTAAAWRQAVPVANPEVIGCYGNGMYANHSAAREAFPAATIIVYDVNGSMPSCDLLDVEPMDAVPADAPGWASRHNETGAHTLPFPALYCSASAVNEVEHDLETALKHVLRLSAHVSRMLDGGFRRNEFLIHSAHYGWAGGYHICGPGTCGFPQADGTQDADHGPQGQNVDHNTFGDHFFAAVKPPDPDARYGLFDDVHRTLVSGKTERQVVQRYDVLRATQTHTHHPHRIELGLLRGDLALLAARLARVMHGEKHPSAGQIWRLGELRSREHGMRVV